MPRSSLAKIQLTIALVVCAFAIFLSGASPLAAQTASAPESRAGHALPFAYDAARETSLTGNIEEVVTRHVPGSPVGMHLLVSGGAGVVDVHVGPYLTAEAKEALHTGTPVQIVGATVQLHDKEYFLARELNVGGRTIAIRNKRGFLILPRPTRNARIAPAKFRLNEDQANGDAQ